MIQIQPPLDLQLPKMEKVHLSDEDFNRISRFVTSNYGIKLPYEKKIMVEGRLQKRLRATQKKSFEEYTQWVLSEEGKYELISMIDAISTNKTDFFREASHFDYMKNELLPSLSLSGKRDVKIWSSAASSGEELYTIAITMEEYNRESNKSPLEYSIHGTDISTQVLKNAVSAVYPFDRIRQLPLELRHKYFLKSKDANQNTVRVIPRLRKKCTYSRLNLIDDEYTINGEFDIIFCRNVLIYFDQFNQEKVINKLCRKLKVGGYFFLGHSESILGKNVPLKQIKPTIYKRV
mgnify:CR=1 FL=1